MLLSSVGIYHADEVHVSAHVLSAKHVTRTQPVVPGAYINTIGTASAGNYRFTNFDGPGAGTNAGTGTNMNGISNSGAAVGFTIDNNGNFNNFTANPLKAKKTRTLNINGLMTAMAFGLNSAGTVVGTDGNGNAFYLKKGAVKTFIPNGGVSAVAFGINDGGVIVGQYTTSTTTPGFIRVTPKSFITINAPSGPNIVNAQGINNHGEVVGFYVGTDGQDHGFLASEKAGHHGVLTGTAIADPMIPPVAGEPGAYLCVFPGPRDK